MEKKIKKDFVLPPAPPKTIRNENVPSIKTQKAVGKKIIVKAKPEPVAQPVEEKDLIATNFVEEKINEQSTEKVSKKKSKVDKIEEVFEKPAKKISKKGEEKPMEVKKEKFKRAPEWAYWVFIPLAFIGVVCLVIFMILAAGYSGEI